MGSLGRKASSPLPRALPGHQGTARVWYHPCPPPRVLPVVTSYAGAVQCPPVLCGCSAAGAAQGTVCEQTSGQSLAAAKESNQRSKGEQRRAEGRHRAGGAWQEEQAEPPSAPHPGGIEAPRQHPLL